LPPSFFTVFDYDGSQFNSTWQPPNGAVSYNITVVPKLSPANNKTYNTSGEVSLLFLQHYNFSVICCKYI